MRIDIITCVPNLLESPFNHSIVQRAKDKGLLEIVIHDLRAYGQGNYKHIDDYQYGGGAGMVLMIEPIANCIRHLQNQRTYDDIIYMTPDGETLIQKTVNTLSLSQNLIILAGHYKGIDERVRELFITKEISIGDYVLSGGELATSILVDAIARLIPGAISDETSALSDSFQDNLLSPPIYTRPAEFEGLQVPQVLFSGNHKAIEEWREEKSWERTQKRRPDLLDNSE